MVIPTANENGMNQKVHVDNTSGKAGVNYIERIKKWQVKMRINGIQIHCGYYQNKSKAILNRNELEEQFFGEFKSTH